MGVLGETRSLVDQDAVDLARTGKCLARTNLVILSRRKGSVRWTKWCIKDGLKWSDGCYKSIRI